MSVGTKSVLTMVLFFVIAAVLYTSMILPWIISMVFVAYSNHSLKRLVGLSQFIGYCTEGY